MMPEIYFYDENNRCIGHRKLNKGEDIPSNATTVSVALQDGQEAYFINGQWVVNEIVEVENTLETQPPTTEEQIKKLAIQVMLAQEALDFLIMGGM